jgi:hypothetical protein
VASAATLSVPDFLIAGGTSAATLASADGVVDAAADEVEDVLELLLLPHPAIAAATASAARPMLSRVWENDMEDLRGVDGPERRSGSPANGLAFG